MTPGDRQLARRFPSGDDAVLRDVYARFGRAVHTVTYSILRDHDLAADATQATFADAWRAASRFDPERELGPWIYTIARRTAIDVHRRRRRFEPTDPADFDREAADAGAGDPLDRTWEAWQVRLAVDDLPLDEQEVVRLSWFAELTHAEIADRLGVPVGTVKSRSHRAHRRLTESLGHVRHENRPALGDVQDSQEAARGGPV